MNILDLAVVAVSCLFIQQPLPACMTSASEVGGAQAPSDAPILQGTSIDVVLTGASALVWDMASDEILYSKNIDERRPVASLSKLLSVLAVRSRLPVSQVVVIPPEVKKTQAFGAHIKLPVGEHTTVDQLLSASLIASANDAMVTLAVAASQSEDAFAQAASQQAASLGLSNTKLANSTGLSGGEQYSTARDLATALKLVYADPVLKPYLSQKKGLLVTQEGSRRAYETTNQLLGTYMPISAAKTGYTTEAGENLAVITSGPDGQEIGAVILGSEQRFQDMKTLVEWIWRNYTWPPTHYLILST